MIPGMIAVGNKYTDNVFSIFFKIMVLNIQFLV